MIAQAGSRPASFSSYTIAILLFSFRLTAPGQTQVVIADGAGKPLRQAPAVVLSDGVVVADRAALAGAGRVTQLSAASTGIAAEDQDAGIVLLRLTDARMLSRFQEEEIAAGAVLAGPGFASIVEKEFDVPGFGPVFRLKNEKNHPVYGAPMWNTKGEIAAWYVPKTVDGQRFSFAIPVSRLRCLAPGKLKPVAAWAAQVRAEAEEQFSRSVGYFWVQDFEGAVYHFGQFLKENNTHARGWFYLAFSQGKLGHDRAKMAAYRKVIELSPLWGEPRYNLGLGLLLGGDGAGATAMAAELAEIDPVMGARLQAYLELAHVDPMPVKPPKAEAPASPPPAPR